MNIALKIAALILLICAAAVPSYVNHQREKTQENIPEGEAARPVKRQSAVPFVGGCCCVCAFLFV